MRATRKERDIYAITDVVHRGQRQHGHFKVLCLQLRRSVTEQTWLKLHCLHHEASIVALFVGCQIERFLFVLRAVTAFSNVQKKVPVAFPLFRNSVRRAKDRLRTMPMQTSRSPTIHLESHPTKLSTRRRVFIAFTMAPPVPKLRRYKIRVMLKKPVGSHRQCIWMLKDKFLHIFVERSRKIL